MSNKKRIEEILQKEKANQQEEKIDWAPKIEAWKSQVDGLFAMIEGWLKPSSEKNYIVIKRDRISLSEEHLGTYETQRLFLHIGSKKIELEPIGMLILGARGRVDINGPKGGKVMLLLLGENEAPEVRVTIGIEGQQKKSADQPEKEQSPGRLVWKVAQKNPNLNVFPLTEDIFADIIDQLL